MAEILATTIATETVRNDDTTKIALKEAGVGASGGQVGVELARSSVSRAMCSCRF